MDQSAEAIAKRDKRLFRFFICSICSLPILLIVVTLLLPRNPRLEDSVTAIYLWIGLLLFLSLFVFSIRVWRRNRRLAWMGFGFIAFIIMLGVLLALLPHFV